MQLSGNADFKNNCIWQALLNNTFNYCWDWAQSLFRQWSLSDISRPCWEKCPPSPEPWCGYHHHPTTNNAADGLLCPALPKISLCSARGCPSASDQQHLSSRPSFWKQYPTFIPTFPRSGFFRFKSIRCLGRALELQALCMSLERQTLSWCALREHSGFKGSCL